MQVTNSASAATDTRKQRRERSTSSTRFCEPALEIQDGLVGDTRGLAEGVGAEAEGGATGRQLEPEAAVEGDDVVVRRGRDDPGVHATQVTDSLRSGGNFQGFLVSIGIQRRGSGVDAEAVFPEHARRSRKQLIFFRVVRIKILSRRNRNLDHALPIFGSKEPLAVKKECRIAYLRGEIRVKTTSNGGPQSG